VGLNVKKTLVRSDVERKNQCIQTSDGDSKRQISDNWLPCPEGRNMEMSRGGGGEVKENFIRHMEKKRL